MRKQFLLMLILCLTASMAWAERIDVATARKVAESVARREGATSGLRSAGELPLVYAAAPGQSGSALRSGAMEGAADYFVFNFPGGKGFAIVAGDDRVRPVLGYSDEGGFDPDNLPENLCGWLAGYQTQITWAVNKGMEATPEIVAEWSQLLSGTALRASTTGEKLIQTANWNQSDPYNRQTPTIGGQHTITGCVATATAIIMRHHQYPTTAVTGGVNSYDPSRITGKTYDRASFPVSYAPYDWTNMPLDYPSSPTTAQANAVSALMWNIGANINMGYTLNESGASTSLAVAKLHQLFGYGNELRLVRKRDFTWEDWYQLIRTEIDNNRPILYDGQSQTGGHAFICDGYADGNYFHFNWGWGGYGNNYCLLTVMTPGNGGSSYNLDNSMAIGVKPPAAGEQHVKEIRYTDLYTTIASLPVGKTFQVNIEFANTGNTSFNALINMAIVDASGAWKQNIGENSNCFLDFEETYYHGYSKYSQAFVCTLPNELSAGEKILPVYSLDNGATWKIMGKAQEAPICINMKGTILEGDDPDNPTMQKMEAQLDWNAFDRVLLLASGLDESTNQLLDHNTQRINYKFRNANEGVIMHFTFPNLSAWSKHIKMYYAINNDIRGENKGTAMTIDTNGEAKIPVSLDQMMDPKFGISLRVLSDKVGKLDYSLRLFAESNPQMPLTEEKDKQMTFIPIPDYGIDPNPIRGIIGEDVDFKLHIRDLDASLLSNNMRLSPSIYSSVDLGDIELYHVEGTKESKVELNKTAFTGQYSYYEGYMEIGKPVVGQTFTFRLKNVNQEVGAVNGNWASIRIALMTEDYVDIPSNNNHSSIVFTQTAPKVHGITYNLENLLLDYSRSTVEDGKGLSLRLIPKTGYNLPTEVEIKMGEHILIPSEGYFYNNGLITIYSVSDDVTITAKGVEKPVPTYQVTVNVTNLPEVTAEAVKENTNLTLTLRASDTYDLPGEIAVTMGDVTLKQGEGYTYDPSTGIVVVKEVTAEIVITAIGKKKPVYFLVKQELTNLTSDKADEVKVLENTKHELTLKVTADYYKLPGGINIYDADNNSFTDFNYDRATGKVTINKVTSNLTIKATAIDDRHYDVVFDMEGVKANPTAVGPFEINATPEFAVTFSAEEGYTYDGAITVRMGDQALTAGTDYTYAEGTFKLNVPLTATLTITAKGVKKQYSITVTFTNLSSDITLSAVAHGDPLSFNIMPDEGYNLPKSIEVKMGGTLLTAGEGYAYNKADGTVSIEKVTGAVEVIAEGVLKTYEVKLNLTNLTSGFIAGTKVKHGESLEIQLIAKEGYQLPKIVSVIMSGKPDTNFMYENGKISISKVLGPIEITAVADKVYNVEENVENLTIEAPKNVVEGETFIATLNVASGYHRPYAINVVMNGRLLRADEYSYNHESGKIEIKNVSGPITISAKGIQDGYFEVVLNLANLTSEPTSFEPQAKDSKIELTLKPSSGYELPRGVTVKMGDATLAAGTDYAYDRSTGKFTLEKITGTLVITASGDRIPEPEPEPEPTPTTYTVTLPVVEGATISASGSTTVTAGNDFSFIVEVKAGYNADNMVVKANGTTLTPDANGRYTVANIRSNVVVTVTGIVKDDNPTANETINSDELRVWASKGRLFIQTPVADTAYIVAFDGRVYKTLSLSAGEYTEAMPQGSYIIHIGKRSYKLNF